MPVKNKNNFLLENVRPIPTKGTTLRIEKFGGMLAGGNMPILNINEDGLAIWNLCTGKRTVKEIEVELEKEFEDKDLQGQLREFIQYCLSNGFLEDNNDN